MSKARRALSRRRFLGLGMATAPAFALAACGGDVASPTTSPNTADSFPVSITDKFGTVTVDRAPKTIAAVGRTDHDVLLALGVIPATVYRFVPLMKRGVGVWAESKLGSANPTILTNPINVEQVATAAPDLILNVQSNGDEAEYQVLTKIAPTIGLPKDAAPNTVSWQDSTRIIATALDRKADGDEVIRDTEAVLSDAKAANPSFHGKTISILLSSGRQLGVYTTNDTRMKVATALGLASSAYVAGLDATKYFIELSPELVENADADIVLVLTREGLSRTETLALHPTLAGSAAAKENRLVVVEDINVSLALSAGSVLSIPFAVNGLLPLLKNRFG